MSSDPAAPPPTADRRAHLADLLAARSARRGSFTLASGRTSDLYIDARLTTMSPDGLALIGPLALEAIEAAGWRADAVGGLTLGADPVAYAVAYASTVARGPEGWVRAFTVRKQPKAHGTGRLGSVVRNPAVLRATTADHAPAPVAVLNEVRGGATARRPDQSRARDPRRLCNGLVWPKVG